MFGAETLLLSAVSLAALLLEVWALADAVFRPGAAYVAAGKLTKPAWIAILAAGLVLTRGSLGLFGLVAIVAAIVYLVDVRPAVRAARPGGDWA